MKIRLLVSRAGLDFVQNAGDIIDVPSDEAQRMIEAGQCVPVKAGRRKAIAPDIETPEG